MQYDRVSSRVRAFRVCFFFEFLSLTGKFGVGLSVMKRFDGNFRLSG